MNSYQLSIKSVLLAFAIAVSTFKHCFCAGKATRKGLSFSWIGIGDQQWHFTATILYA